MTLPTQSVHNSVGTIVNNCLISILRVQSISWVFFSSGAYLAVLMIVIAFIVMNNDDDGTDSYQHGVVTVRPLPCLHPPVFITEARRTGQWQN